MSGRRRRLRRRTGRRIRNGFCRSLWRGTGDVGLPEQILIGDGALGNGDAHADGDGVVDIAVFEQVADGGAEGLRACADTRDFRNVAHVDVEFVAAHAPDDVVLPEGAPKLAGRFP